jgi:hypothetical protein
VEMTKKQTEFWAFIIMICLAVSIAVLLVDFGIKAAILEESTKLRLLIEENSGRKNQESATGRTDNDADINSSVPSDILLEYIAPVETGDVPNGTAEKVRPSPARRAKSRRPGNPGTIPSGDK